MRPFGVDFDLPLLDLVYPVAVLLAAGGAGMIWADRRQERPQAAESMVMALWLTLISGLVLIVPDVLANRGVRPDLWPTPDQQGRVALLALLAFGLCLIGLWAGSRFQTASSGRSK